MTLPHHDRITRLRQALATAGVAAFIIPHADAFQNEYLPACSEHLAYFTGFTGSAGTAIITAQQAVLFVDGRYRLQAPAETDPHLFTILDSGTTSPTEWLAATLPAAFPEGAQIGFDPWLHPQQWLESSQQILNSKNLTLRPLTPSPIETLWRDRPPSPAAPFHQHADIYAGESSAAKRQRMAIALQSAGISGFIITAPASLAWLLNIRGSDVPHTPLPLAYAILYDDARVDLYAEESRCPPALQAALGNAVTLCPPDRFLSDITHRSLQQPLGADMSLTASAIIAAGQGRIMPLLSPLTLPQACKNPQEVAGARHAHARDGVAMVRCLAWLAETAPTGTLDELSVMAHLQALRQELPLFYDLSFATIAGAGAHGAIVHYHATPASTQRVETGTLFLLDSGAQYHDGTTDITRTIAIGTPTAAMKDHYTRVLKGHLALAAATFPQGVTGHQLDALARQALWQVGLDYDHGTGHGVGSFLSVHEGPQRISARATPHNSLYEGMILSNEPGYYRAGAYGIRIENLMVVEKRLIEGAERPMLGFETLTLCPYDRQLIERALLTPAEINQINAYHQRVYAVIMPQLDALTIKWLAAACAPL